MSVLAQQSWKKEVHLEKDNTEGSRTEWCFMPLPGIKKLILGCTSECVKWADSPPHRVVPRTT